MPSERATKKAREFGSKHQDCNPTGDYFIVNLAALLDAERADAVAPTMETCPACGEEYLQAGQLDRALALRKQIEACVRADEREACAKVADGYANDAIRDGTNYGWAAEEISAAIRARKVGAE